MAHWRRVGRSREVLGDDAALGASQLSGIGRSRNSGGGGEGRAGTQAPGAASNRLPHGILCNPAPRRGVGSSWRTLNEPAAWPRRTRCRCSSASSRDSASSSRSRGCPSSWYPKPSVSWRFVYKRSGIRRRARTRSCHSGSVQDQTPAQRGCLTHFPGETRAPLGPTGMRTASVRRMKINLPQKHAEQYRVMNAAYEGYQHGTTCPSRNDLDDSGFEGVVAVGRSNSTREPIRRSPNGPLACQSSPSFRLPTSLPVKVRIWHDPAALSTGQPVRFLGQCSLSLARSSIQLCPPLL